MIRTRRALLATPLVLSLLLMAGAAQADCPAGSGIEIPFLTDSELSCQNHTYNATVEYLGTIVDSRQDCFLQEINGKFVRENVDCLGTLALGGTGDDDTDDRLRKAEATLTRRILTHCVGVELINLGFPGFCPDPDEPPYDTFDHVQCLMDSSKALTQFILDTEHPTTPPPGPGSLDLRERVCSDFVARSSANMTRGEIHERSKCLFKQLQGNESEDTDCRRELDPQDPDTGRLFTDNRVIEFHNLVLRGIANHCPIIDLDALGFPHRCEYPPATAFPLPELVECMYHFHHTDIFRFVDILFPCSTDCGNARLDREEGCDDGDIESQQGDLCRNNCTRVACGDPTDDGVRNITDALFILRAAVGLQSCALQICDVDSSLKITTADALRSLMFSVGLPVELFCPELSLTCGNGFLEELEECDDGDTDFERGQYCNATCQLLQCGDPNDSGQRNLLDAVFIIGAAVGNNFCDFAVCDLTGNGIINSTDALRSLMNSVLLPVRFRCPDAPETPLPPDPDDL